MSPALVLVLAVAVLAASLAVAGVVSHLLRARVWRSNSEIPCLVLDEAARKRHHRSD